MIDSLIQNVDALSKVWFTSLAVWTIIFQWWLIVHLYRENKKESKILIDINNNVIKEFTVITQGLKVIAESNAKINERIDEVLLHGKKWVDMFK